MPYYHVIFGEPMRVSGERETYIREVSERPLSFTRKHEFGTRKQVIFGKRQLSVDILDHDRMIVSALRDVELDLIVHETDPKPQEIIDVDFPLAIIQTEPGERIRHIKLLEGGSLNLYRSSVAIRGNNKAQIRWSENMEYSEEVFKRLAESELSGFA